MQFCSHTGQNLLLAGQKDRCAAHHSPIPDHYGKLSEASALDVNLNLQLFFQKAGHPGRPRLEPSRVAVANSDLGHFFFISP